MAKATTVPSGKKTDDKPGMGFVDPNYVPKTLRGSVLIPEEGDISPSEWKAIRDWMAQHRLGFSNVLVLYTGGTIGMKQTDNGLAPVPNHLEGVLRELPMFYDRAFAEKIHLPNKLHWPLVLPTEWFDEDLGKQLRSMKTLKYGPSKPNDNRILYYILEYDPIIDSSNMTMSDWIKMANDIKKFYPLFDAFVILHGTDTMAYTSSGLSFIIEDLGKPVVITGSQLSLYETRSDGRDNLMGALQMAGHYVIPEVTLYFDGKLMRGNRTIKEDSAAFDAFFSPNMSPLAELEIAITVDWSAVIFPPAEQNMIIHTNLNNHVGVLRLFPSISVDTVKQYLQPPMLGVVLQTYGAGNGPDKNQPFLDALQEATNRGVIIVNITQCIKGGVSGSYATGEALQKVGVIPGGDMTTEAGLAKLAYVLGRDDWNQDTKREKIGQNLRGEMTSISPDGMFVDIPILEKMKKSMNITSEEEMEQLSKGLITQVMSAVASEGDVATLKKLQKLV